MFIYCWEENDHVSSTVFFPIGCRSRKSLFICIKLKYSELCCVAGHALSGRQRTLSLTVARVAISGISFTFGIAGWELLTNFMLLKKLNLSVDLIEQSLQ